MAARFCINWNVWVVVRSSHSIDFLFCSLWAHRPACMFCFQSDSHAESDTDCVVVDPPEEDDTDTDSTNESESVESVSYPML